MSGLGVVSLFAGVGGIDLAAEQEGMRTLLACEIDKACRTVLGRRFPDAVIHDDVRTLTADDLRRAGAVPSRTVVTAGFPCQDLSVAGRRKGMGEGTRSGLFWHVDRLLAEFRPAWVLLENVAGLLSATCPCLGDGRCGDGCPGETHQVAGGGACDRQCIRRHGGVMGAVVGSLGERGYGFAYRVLDARFFGVPQRRRRVIVVGRLGDSGAAPAEILFEPEGVFGDSAAGGEAGAGVAAGVGTGAARGGWVADLAPTLESGTNSTGGVRPPGTTVDTAESLVVSGRAGCIPIQDGRAVAKAQNGVGVGNCGDPSYTLDTTGAQAVGVLGDHSHALTAEGADASEDGTGRGTPVVAFHITQDPISGDVAPAMGTGNAQGCATIGVAYTADEVSSLLAGGGDRGYRIGAEEAAGGQLVAYPLAVRGREDGAELEIGEPGDPMFALRVGNGGSSRSQLVAVHENQRGEITVTNHAAALATPGGKPGQGYPAVTDGVIVRRLTPLECERLQGCPDQWTDVDGASDSQRYRQMGNSVAVPVLAWVMRRLIAVDASAERAA